MKTEVNSTGSQNANPQPPFASLTSHGRTHNEIINNVVDYIINDLKVNPRDITPEEMEHEVIALLEEQFSLENAMRPKGAKYTPPHALPPDVIAELMVALYHIRKITFSGLFGNEEYDLIGIYVDDGPNRGIYTTSEIELKKVARRFNRRLAKKDFDAIMFALNAIVPRTERCTDRDLIAVNNGIVDYRSKKLLPFTPDLVFTAKSRIDYNPLARNVVINNPDDRTDWDVEAWMQELSDDPDVVRVLWQIIGAVIRPNVRWDKSAWFCSSTGNNGKGTLCSLLRNLCGVGSYSSIPLADFSKDFALEPLIRSTAIIVDENDVGGYLDKVANLKAVVTNDVVAINRKFKTPIAYQFHGFMVQCVNEMPRTKDRSGSFYRRQLIIPFDKCYTGKERKYIKDDYLKRTDVLEYVLKRVITMDDYYELDVPVICKQALADYMEYNDPVRSFCEEILPQCKWDLLPYDFLFELYKKWFEKNYPRGCVQGRNTFLDDLRQYSLTNNTGWAISKKGSDGKETPQRSKSRMVGPEPLIFEYEVKSWYNIDYTGHDRDRVSTPILKEYYRGLIRISSVNSDDEDIGSDGGNDS